MPISCIIYTITVLAFLCSCVSIVYCQIWTPILVKNITTLGPQNAPDVTNVSRDGGFSALINGNIVWLYDDTECMDLDGNQLSFVSNTAAYADQANKDVSTVKDFGIVNVGEDGSGREKYAILADTTVRTGGWIPFTTDELSFNKERTGRERVAIWPGTCPTPISIADAFLFAPLVYVDSRPQDPSKKYQARGMTLISIKAPSSGPIVTRQSESVRPGTEVGFGGFSALLGFVSTNSGEVAKDGERDVYLLGIANGGLQLARVGLNHIKAPSKYMYFNPKSRIFSRGNPRLDLSDESQIYLPGNFSAGSVFYSPYFSTFIMIYFNKMVDSTFYIRYLDIDDPVWVDGIWTKGGKNGEGIQAEDAEALVKYPWSPEQILYISPPGRGGFNYAGMAHPQFFNRQYFAKSLYPLGIADNQRKNDWYGSEVIAEASAGGDGKHILLSWTSQLGGGPNAGKYKIQLAVLEFDEIPVRPGTITSIHNSIPEKSESRNSLASMLTHNCKIGRIWALLALLDIIEALYI